MIGPTLGSNPYLYLDGRRFGLGSGQFCEWMCFLHHLIGSLVSQRHASAPIIIQCTNHLQMGWFFDFFVARHKREECEV
jgi:hypothetical protein